MHNKVKVINRKVLVSTLFRRRNHKYSNFIGTLSLLLLDVRFTRCCMVKGWHIASFSSVSRVFELITKYKPKVFESQITRLKAYRRLKKYQTHGWRTNAYTERAGRSRHIRSKGKIDSWEGKIVTTTNRPSSSGRRS